MQLNNFARIYYSNHRFQYHDYQYYVGWWTNSEYSGNGVLINYLNNEGVTNINGEEVSRKEGWFEDN